jgi:hypothetical protein
LYILRIFFLAQIAKHEIGVCLIYLSSFKKKSIGYTKYEMFDIKTADRNYEGLQGFAEFPSRFRVDNIWTNVATNHPELEPNEINKDIFLAPHCNT